MEALYTLFAIQPLNNLLIRGFLPQFLYEAISPLHKLLCFLLGGIVGKGDNQIAIRGFKFVVLPDYLRRYEPLPAQLL